MNLSLDTRKAYASALLAVAGSESETWEVEGHGLYLLIAGTLIWGFGDLAEYLW